MAAARAFYNVFEDDVEGTIREFAFASKTHLFHPFKGRSASFLANLGDV